MNTKRDPSPCTAKAKAKADADAVLRAGDLPTTGEMLAAMQLVRRYLRAKHFDPGGRDGVAHAIEALIARFQEI